MKISMQKAYKSIKMENFLEYLKIVLKLSTICGNTDISLQLLFRESQLGASIAL